MKYNYKPSLREVHSSLKYRSREYFLENSLHGVPYFVDPTRPKWERLTWFFLTFLSVVGTFVIIVIIWEKFQTEPTITGLDIVTKDIDIEFPQLFICFDWSNLNHSRLHKVTENEMFIYEQVYNWNFGMEMRLEESDTIHKNKNNFRSIFESIAPDCNDLISNCVYKGMKISCKKVFTKVLVSVGACCKFKTAIPLQHFDASWKFEFEASTLSFPWRLYFVQNADLTPKRDDRPVVTSEHPVDIQFIVDVTYNTRDIRYLTLHQRGCYYSHEGVSLNDCEINCFTDQIFSHCGCVPWFLSLVDKPECPLSRYSCLNFSNIDIKQCNCWISCNHTSHGVRGITYSGGNVNRIMLRNWPTALYKREMRFGYLDLLVSFGGIASLFLGYSLIASIELGYYFSLKTYCGAVIKSSRTKYNINTIRVSEKPPPKLDIVPKYYQYVN